MDKLILRRVNNLIERDPISHGFHGKDLDELNDLSSILLQKTACRGCTSDQESLYLELKNFINSNNSNNQIQNTMANSKFVLPENRIFHDGQGGVFTNKNLTDEDAVRALSHNPKAIRQFLSAPKDWEDMVEEYEAEIKEFQAKNKTKKKPIPGTSKVKSKATSDESEEEDDDDEQTEGDENDQDENEEEEKKEPVRSPISPKKPEPPNGKGKEKQASKKPGK